MGKGARIRRERAVKDAERDTLPARHVLPPGVAREQRQRNRRAFRAFQQLPLEQRRAWMKDDPTENTDTTEENHG